MSAVSDLVKEFPFNPGVYIMKNTSGTVIYVGKAKSLKKRVSQYFLPGRDVKTRALVSHIDTISYIITASEYEALILENNLIKKYKPRYNIDLKDDKTYQMIKITDEDFPRVLKTRRKTDDGSKYYGPFPNGEDLELYFGMLESEFTFRRCRGVLKKAKNPCLYHHIGQCSAPCAGLADKSDYRNGIFRIERMLEGDTANMEERLTRRMREHAAALEFEAAKNDRDVLAAMRRIAEFRTVSASKAGDVAKDYIALFAQDSVVSVSIMQFRNGNLVGNACYHRQTFSSPSEVMASFMLQYYGSQEELPDKIVASEEFAAEQTAQYFEENLRKVEILPPSDTRDFRLVGMARANAKNDLEKYLREKRRRDAAAAGDVAASDVDGTGGDDVCAADAGDSVADVDDAADAIAGAGVGVGVGSETAFVASGIVFSPDVAETSCAVSDGIAVAEDAADYVRKVAVGSSDANSSGAACSGGGRARMERMLKEIPRVGDRKAARISGAYGSLEALLAADSAEIAGKCGISRYLAELIKKRLRF